MINDKWLLFFAHSIVEFFSPGDSNHCPALVQLVQAISSPPKPFKLFNFWTRHPEFLNTITQSWKEPILGSPMVILQKKIKRLKQCLKNFNKTHYVGISLRVIKKRQDLEEI